MTEPCWCSQSYSFLQGSCRLSPLSLIKCVCVQDTRQTFRSVLVEATLKLDELLKKLGRAVEESKPYWEARRSARQVSHVPRPGFMEEPGLMQALVVSHHVFSSLFGEV